MGKKPNIILVVFDTLRWDYFQKFLDEKSTSKEELIGFLNFENAYSPSSWTLPSHFSLFTGLFPSEHGIHETPDSEMFEIFDKALNYKGRFLSTLASSYGYRTIGITANPMLCDLTGFRDKFDEFYNINLGTLTGLDSGRDIKRKSKLRKFRYSIRMLIMLLRGFPKNKGYKISSSLFKENNLQEPFFAFLNLMEMHDPYFKTLFRTDDNKTMLNALFKVNQLKKKKVNKLRQKYYIQEKKVLYTINETIKTLKEKNKFDDSIIIITSDHGQAIDECSYYGHGVFLYDELIHIPLLVKLPKGVNGKFDTKSYINLTDIYEFLSPFIKGDLKNCQFNFRDETFSEAFGIQYSKESVQKFLTDSSKLNIYKEINTSRKSVLKNGMKLTINSNSKVEEFKDTNNFESLEEKMTRLKDLITLLEIFNIDKDFLIDRDLILRDFLTTS